MLIFFIFLREKHGVKGDIRRTRGFNRVRNLISAITFEGCAVVHLFSDAARLDVRAGGGCGERRITGRATLPQRQACAVSAW